MRYYLAVLLIFLSSSGLTAERPLTSKERQEHYLQLIESFIGWTEATGQFVEDDTLEPGGGCFKGSGSGVTWARGNGNLLVAYAVLLDAYPDRQEFCTQKVPRKVLMDHLRRAIRSVCLANKHCSRHVDSKFTWGGPSWQGAFELLGTAWAAHLMEKELDRSTRALVRGVVCKEADNLDKPIPSMTPGNTGSEDCSWNAPLAALAACKYADDPRAPKWDELAKRWAVNACSIESDRTSEQLVDSRPLKEWISSVNAFPDLTMENHGFWDQPYQFAFHLLGRAELAYRVFNRPVPETITFRIPEMWRQIQGVVSLGDGDMLQPHGYDWGWKDYQHVCHYAWLSTFRGISEAGAFESQALKMLMKRQTGIGTGDMKSLNFGYQTVLLARWAFASLMHKHSPAEQTADIDTARKQFHGIHIFLYVKTAIHRTSQKAVSVSWHPKSQAIMIIPDDTSTDPPFYFVNESGTGNASVTVTVDGVNLPLQVHQGQAVSEAGGMRASYRRTWGDAVTQYAAVVSLPDEMMIYLTAFHAARAADVEMAPLFPQRVAQLPGLPNGIKQYRGERWLNLSDRIGFVSAFPLPAVIPDDRFYLTAPQRIKVKPGEWFGKAAVVVCIGQTHDKTASITEAIKMEEPEPGCFSITIPNHPPVRVDTNSISMQFSRHLAH